MPLSIFLEVIFVVLQGVIGGMAGSPSHSLIKERKGRYSAAAEEEIGESHDEEKYTRGNCHDAVLFKAGAHHCKKDCKRPLREDDSEQTNQMVSGFVKERVLQAFKQNYRCGKNTGEEKLFQCRNHRKYKKTGHHNSRAVIYDHIS